MSNLKLTDYEDASSTFTLTYNPNAIEFVTNKFVDQRNLPYSFAFLGFTSPIKSSINIGINGHVSGTNKNTEYRSLVKKINNPILLKLYFENTYDKFYLCTGTNIQKVPTGNRPLHIDYVGNFFSPFGILFDETQQEGEYNSTKSNGGDMDTPIEKITGGVTSGLAVTIKDVNNNGFTFTPNASGTMTYYIVKVNTTDNNIYFVEYMYIDVGGVQQIIKNADVSGDLMLKLTPGQKIVDLFTGVNGNDYDISGITDAKFYFRDGWSSD